MYEGVLIERQVGEEDRRHLGTEQRMESQLSNGLTPLLGRGGTLEQYL